MSQNLPWLPKQGTYPSYVYQSAQVREQETKIQQPGLKMEISGKVKDGKRIICVREESSI